MNLTKDLLTAHRRALASTAQVSAPAPAPAAAAPAASTLVLSAADQFKKSIKWDMTAFKPLKDRKNWNPWYRDFVATAKAQGLGNILDPTYMPSTPDEQALFDILQDYAFAVLTRCLVEAQAADLVRSYTGTLAGANAGNAQKLHEALYALMSTGITARTQRTTLESKLIALHLDQSWNRGICAFLTHFSHLLKDLRELRDPSDTTSYNDTWCMSTIDTALGPHKEMSSHVSSLATMRSALQAASTTALPALTFADYFVQLHNHAIVLDDKNTKARQTARVANQAQQITKNRGGRGNAGGHSSGRGGSSGRSGTGRGSGLGRGNRGRCQAGPNDDVTDPAVWLSDAQYGNLKC